MIIKKAKNTKKATTAKAYERLRKSGSHFSALTIKIIYY